MNRFDTMSKEAMNRVEAVSYTHLRDKRGSSAGWHRYPEAAADPFKEPDHGGYAGCIPVF